MSPQIAPLTVVLRGGDRELARAVLHIVVPADLATIDRLARLQLNARRWGCAIRIVDPPPCVGLLIEITGLSGVLIVEGRAWPRV